MTNVQTEHDGTRVRPLERRVSLHHGTALDLLRPMPDASAAAVVTDPPYGTGRWARQERFQQRRQAVRFEREEWDEWDTVWIAEALRVATGPVALFCPQVRLGEMIALAEAVGEPWRMLLWCKPDPHPRFDMTALGFEPVFVLRSNLLRGGRDWMSASAPRLGRDNEFAGHPHQKPLTVLRWIVRLCSPPGDLVIDPFLGSGTTAEACAMEGRRCIGGDQDAGWLDVAERRVQAVEQAPTLFGAG